MQNYYDFFENFFFFGNKIVYFNSKIINKLFVKLKARQKWHHIKDLKYSLHRNLSSCAFITYRMKEPQDKAKGNNLSPYLVIAT